MPSSPSTLSISVMESSSSAEKSRQTSAEKSQQPSPDKSQQPSPDKSQQPSQDESQQPELTTPNDILHSWIPEIPSHFSIISSGPNQHTLTTTIPLEADSPLLSIPDTHIITTSIALTTFLVQKVLAQHPAPAPTTGAQASLLLYLLLCQRDPFFSPYFKSIPSRIITATTSKSVRNLEGTPLCHLSLALRRQLDDLFHGWFTQIKTSFPEFKDVTRNQFLNAHAILESRAISYGRIADEDRKANNEADHEQSILLPFIDFCNHDMNPNCYLNASFSSLKLFTKRDIAAGEELTICYGELPNMLLLLHWGFAIPNNAFDEIPLSLDEPDDVARHIMLSVLVGEPDFVLTMDDPLPKLLVRAIRIMVVGDVSNGVKKNFDVPLKKEEGRVVEVLRELMQSLRCPNTPEQNPDEASKGEMAVEEVEYGRYCRIYRAGIERILDAGEIKIAEMEKSLTDFSRD